MFTAGSKITAMFAARLFKVRKISMFTWKCELLYRFWYILRKDPLSFHILKSESTGSRTTKPLITELTEKRGEH